jgi:tetratricopeptide (TPR) repeat protein
MGKIRMKMILVFLACAAFCSAQAEQALGPEASSLAFAEKLYAERDFYRAITEYKRYLFMHSELEIVPWIRLRLGQSYLAGRRLQAAQMVFDELLEVKGAVELRQAAAFSMARAYYLGGRLFQSLNLLSKLEGTPSMDLEGVAGFLGACVHIKMGQLSAARRELAAIPADHHLHTRARALIHRLAEGEHVPTKSPWMAGALSLVPGLGHLYIDEPGMGVAALGWNALFSYAAVDSFQKGQTGLAVLFSAFELLWYSGTIYGAVSGAHRYNRDAVKNYIEGLDESFGLDVSYPKDEFMTAILLSGKF